MFKRLILALATVAGLLSPAYAAGTIPFSLSQQFDQYGKPLNGCRLYLYRAGTTTPQSAYQDANLTTVLPNPVLCDAAGRLPQFFLADGSIKLRLVDKNGVVQVAADGVLVIGPSGGGGGGGGTVDPTTILSTGDVKTRYGTGTLAGYVRLNGRTIGSSTSGASERANADCQALFEYLWNSDSTLTVSSGRGASANADWVANKTITIPDFRGRAMAALTDMGNSGSGTFTGVTFQSGDATTLGSRLGAAQRTLVKANLPNFSPVFSGNAATINVTSARSDIVFGTVAASQEGGGGSIGVLVAGTRENNSLSSSGSYTPTGSISSLGSSTAFDAISPYVLITVYIKL